MQNWSTFLWMVVKSTGLMEQKHDDGGGGKLKSEEDKEEDQDDDGGDNSSNSSNKTMNFHQIPLSRKSKFI
jgi:hypothetical protein